MSELVISGVGVTSAVGQGRQAFTNALMAGAHRFDVMRRPGRQWLPAAGEDGPQPATRFLGAEIPNLALPDAIGPGVLRTASLSSQIAVATLHEAWNDAGLDAVDPLRIGLFVGGSNFQQRELANLQGGSARRFTYLRPTYGMVFMDTDLCGICTELFGIRAVACTVGGASASGQLAVIQALHAVQSGQVDACIALGAMTDLSCWESQAFRSMGAMGSDRFADDPARACRPFDRAHDGFIFGECCGALVIERLDLLERRGGTPYARAAGWSVRLEGNRNPDPSRATEAAVIEQALAHAGWDPAQIDYVNPHGSGSPLGDEVELQALRQAGIAGVLMNSTKSIVGHGLAAAGAVELVATVLQMREGRLHPSRNLDDPIDASFEWVLGRPQAHRIERALKLSFGFGGMNTALCLQRM